jgi:hypothetical protein
VPYADTWHWVDYSYEGLPAFYPPLLPWVAGRLSVLTDLAPWHALKLVSISAMALAPLVSYLLWRRILPVHLAVFTPVALTALVSTTPSMLQQPGAILALAVVVPWWVDSVYGVRGRSVSAWPFWLSGVVGALVFCTYYYFFFPTAAGAAARTRPGSSTRAGSCSTSSRPPPSRPRSTGSHVTTGSTPSTPSCSLAGTTP